MFEIGDIVEITDESYATGMLDFTRGKGYKVEAVDYNGKEWCAHNIILLKDESSKKDWYNVSHFKLKEDGDQVNKTFETDFRVGQTVYDAAYGKGKVVEVKSSGSFPIGVEFESSRDGVGYFTADGKVLPESQRTLFFSPPTVSGATKPVFVPTFKQGDVLFAYGKDEAILGEMGRIVVSTEDENTVWDEYDIGWLKSHWEFYKLGEKIEFN